MDIEQRRKDARASTNKLILACLALGALLGFGLGIAVADMAIDRVTVVVPDCSGVEV